jgi:hypothetical protein
VLKTGSIGFADTVIDCTVRNLSETGAAIEVMAPLYIPDRFTLVIPSEQLRAFHLHANETAVPSMSGATWKRFRRADKGDVNNRPSGSARLDLCQRI